jgi:hypothetical protein
MSGSPAVLTWPGTSVTVAELEQLVGLLAGERVADGTLAPGARAVRAGGAHQDRRRTQQRHARFVITRLTARNIVRATHVDASWAEATLGELRYRLTPARRLFSNRSPT